MALFFNFWKYLPSYILPTHLIIAHYISNPSDEFNSGGPHKLLKFIIKIVRGAPNCAKKCDKRLVVQISAGNGLKCEYVWETAKSAIPHPLHLNIASASSQ